MPGALESKHTSAGLTLALTLALAVGVSLAPLPEAWRPIPSLAQGPVVPQLISLVTTSSAAAKRKSVGVEPDAERLAPDVPVLPEEEVETEVVEAETSSDAGTPLPTPTIAASEDTLGLANLGPATLTKAMRMEALREKMGSKHVDLDPGCRRMGASGCEENGLEPFFKALRSLRDGSRTTPVRVEHLGDSLIASDHINDVVRERLQERHGSGGKGFLYIDRPTRSGRGVRAGQASPGWEFIRIIDRAPPKDRLPFTGVAFTAGVKESQDVRFDIGDARTAEIFFLAQPGGGSVQVLADGKQLQRVQTRWTPAEVANARVKLPEGTKTLTLKTRGKIELHGVSLENGNPGVVYDTLGLPGAYAGVFLRTHRPYFRAQMRQRKPSLVVLMFGGNEAFRLSRDWTKPEEIKQEAEQLVKLVRESVPDAACLVWSPIDAAVRTMGGDLVPRRGSRMVADVFRDVAKEGGCAYWDALEAMGGEGSSIRWLSSGLLNEDLIHPRAKGSDLLGHLFDLAIQRAYAASSPPRVAAEPSGLQNTEKSLIATFKRLSKLEKGEDGRLGILQIGASHTASHYFTDAMRNALAKRFGDAGRGFISAGKPSDRLKPAGVSRELTGEWTVEDALSATTPGQAYGLGGVRAVGAPGASLRIRFCEGCTAATTPPARLSLYWLDGPGSGQLEVKVDGSAMPPEPAPPEPFTAPTVRVRSFPVTGPAHDIEVINQGGGPLTVLGAALDLEQKGIAYDAVGLPGSTASTLASMEPQARSAQLSSRKPQLLVFWYGTNESGQADLDAEKLRTEYGTLISQLRKDAGGAECLVIGTTDRLQQRADGGWEEAPALARVVTALPEVARAQGCAYWSPRAAMGGDLSMLRWQRDGLGHTDGIHLTPEGYEKLAGTFLSDLLAAYETFKAQPPALATEGG
ncbi:GDSL-type esterase/lipase family protein [Archangium lansingense]|uniref:GDSL-type esterase/lipase family protein n=1 Tax=Archangium lansingense TaxID=2995310 RepID=A0ABT4AJY3_9BACT|nr:GDSL-type esterase/lipase family protein [Archangium lansinium]MCY1082005.1 GDSL-type esterase/lipase family protein [Archangium lansinium]